MRYQPQVIHLISGWQPATFEDEQPIAFATLEEAHADIREYLSDRAAAGMGVPPESDFRIVDLETGEIYPLSTFH